MNAVIYSRYSTDRQDEASIADQFRVCREYAARQGWQVAHEFTDEAISGAALGNRPGAQAALAAVSAGGVLLVNDLSRLSRSQDLAPLLTRLRHRGARVIGVQDGFDSDSRTASMQAGLSGIMSEEFRRMIADRTRSALALRAHQGRPTGGKAYANADVVRWIFERFVEGASCRAIAAELNAKSVPSPGSTWKRTQRRKGGWMGSGVRAILLNERYTGTVKWNTSAWIKDPDTGKRTRRMQPRSEWITRRDESLRIVSDELFRRAQCRIQGTTDERFRTGGRPKYLLSGLLVCDRCGANFVMADARSYACSSHALGRACNNTIRITRKAAESAILGPVREELLAPERVARMAREMQEVFAAQTRAASARAESAPKELVELDARIGRLRGRLAGGDPDMEADEIQAAIDAAEAKRDELRAAQPAVKQNARIVAMLPKAADLYRRQIAEGLDGNERQALKARALLRDLFGGQIRLQPENDGSLWATYETHPAALLRQGAGIRGSGGRI